MGGKTERYEFEASPERLWAAAIQSVGTLGYTVIMSDSTSKIVSFNTGRSMKSWGGQDLSATVTTGSRGASLIMGGSLARGGGPMGGGSQLASWGEKGALIKKFAGAVAAALPSVPEPQQHRQPSGDLGSELAKLAELRSSGALTEDEFQAAKARLIT